MHRRIAPLALTLALLAGMTVASGVSDISKPDPSRLGQAFDARAGLPAVAPTNAQVDAIVALVRAYPDVRLEWNARFGTPSSILRHGDTLTQRPPGTPAAAARTWLASHAALFGWRSADVGALRVQKTLTQPNGGARTVLFHQSFNGLEGGSFGGSIVVALDRENRILSVRANAVRAPALANGVQIGAARALSIASHARASKVLGRKGEWTRFARGAFAADHWARKVAFPQGTGAARPAWEVIFAKGMADGYRTVVDALTGEVLYRYQMAKFEAPEGRVFDNYPGAPRGGTHEMRSFAGDPKASPEGWFSPVSGAAPALTTFGNNASTATNWFVSIGPDGPGQIRPISPTGVFDYEFTDSWAASECGLNPISEPGGQGDTPTYAVDALPAVTNLFYHHNVMHDYFYNLGFTEEAGAMQVYNFGKTDPNLQGDPLLGLVQAGALVGDAVDDESPVYGRDNAYMFANPDGLPQWSGMFLWEPIPTFRAPCVDGDFDSGVIYHEYTHGVSSRWVGGEFGNLESHHGGSMGESWSDFYALHYLQSHGLETTTLLGPYVTSDEQKGIRNFPVGEVPLTLADIGWDITGEEVHTDGEIWNGVLWDIRTALAKARPNGAALAAQLVADAMPISGPKPSMVNMRDAILQADVARTKGANQDILWTAFARRGFGASAFAKDGADINPIPAFNHKNPARNGRLTGSVVDAATGVPVAGAKVIVGRFEARVSPLARTASDGSFSVSIVDGTYPLTIQSRGYGSRTFTITVDAGEVTERQFQLPLNYASRFTGGKIADVSNPSALGPAPLAIDDTEASSWRTDEDENGPNGESFVIDLAGDSPISIREIQVSGYKAPGPGATRYETVKQWEISTSLDGKTFTPLARGGFPYRRLRPRAEDVHYRTTRLAKPVSARFLKMVAVAPQDEFPGRVQLGDVQIFGQGPAIKVAAAVAQSAETFHDEGTALVPGGAGPLTATVMEELGALGQCGIPPTQGIDAWVSELPETFGDGTHLIDVRLEPLGPDQRPDIDVYFLTSACTPAGSIATGAPREVGTIPQGSRFVVSELFTTLPGTVIVDAKADISGGGTTKGPRVRGTKQTRPRTLPATGVASGLPPGIGLLGGAAATAFLLRRPRRRTAT